jgi:hypothetical protein
MRFWITAFVGIVFISGMSTAMYLWNPETFAYRPDSEYRPKPLDPYAGQKVPRFEFDRQLDVVENVAQLTQGVSTFKLRNDGEVELQLRLGTKSCTCTAVRIDKNGQTLTRFAKTKELEDLEKQKERENDPTQKETPSEAVEGQGNVNPTTVVTLAPGETADFVFEWDSKDKVGLKQIGGSVFSNDPRADRKEVHFDVRLNIVPEILLDPGYVSFGQLRENQLREETLHIHSPIHSDLKVEYLSASHPSLTAELRPLTDEEKTRLKAKSGWAATVRVNGKLPIGDFSEKLQFRTSIKQHPELTVLAAGMVDGLIEVHPGKVDFGVVTGLGKASTRTVSISTRGLPPEETLAVDEKGIKPEFIRASLRRHPDSQQVWILEMSVDPSGPAGKFQGYVPILDSKGEVRVSVALRGTKTGE